MIRRPPRSTQSRSSAASDVYKRQIQESVKNEIPPKTPRYLEETKPIDEALIESKAGSGYVHITTSMIIDDILKLENQHIPFVDSIQKAARFRTFAPVT